MHENQQLHRRRHEAVSAWESTDGDTPVKRDSLCPRFTLTIFLVLSSYTYSSLRVRYVKAHNYQDAINLLRSGALLLLQHKQSGSGTDLALYLIEVYNLEKTPVTEESRGRPGDESQ